MCSGDQSPRIPDYEINVTPDGARVRVYSPQASFEACQLMNKMALDAWNHIGNQGILHSSGWQALKIMFETTLREGVARGIFYWMAAELHVDINLLLENPVFYWRNQ